MSISLQIRKRLSPDESRAAAVAAARELLRDEGVAAVTLKAVAARIGRTHANLLHHFGSAAGLHRALAEDIARPVVGVDHRGDRQAPRAARRASATWSTRCSTPSRKERRRRADRLDRSSPGSASARPDHRHRSARSSTDFRAAGDPTTDGPGQRWAWSCWPSATAWSATQIAAAQRPAARSGPRRSRSA